MKPRILKLKSHIRHQSFICIYYRTCLWVTLSRPEFTLPTWNEEKCSLGLYCCIVSWWVRGLLRPVFLRLCWETQQLFRQWHVLMCQPGGVRRSVKPLWGPCIPLCYWLLPNEKVVKECCCWVKCVAYEWVLVFLLCPLKGKRFFVLTSWTSLCECSLLLSPDFFWTVSLLVA